MKREISKFDLNLIKIFQVLIETNSVSATCEKLHLSQPTVSRSLSKLRDFFDDELFIRSHYHLEPTLRALKIKQQVLPLFNAFTESLTPDVSFLPEKLEGEITIALNGFLASGYTSDICSRILAKAPNIQLNIVAWDDDTTSQLLKGDIQVGVNYFPLEISKSLYQKKIADDEFVLVCHESNPLLSAQLKPGMTLKLSSLLVHDWNNRKPYAQETLKSIGIQSQIRFRSSYLDSILKNLENSELVFPCSKLLFNKLAGPYKLLPTPQKASAPSGDVGFVSARTLYKSPLHQWLLTEISQCLNG